MLSLIFSLFFLILNALFVLVEFAIVRARVTKFEELAQKGSKAAKISLEITSNINSYLAAIQLGITVSSIGIGWLAQPLITGLINSLFSSFPFIKIYSYIISMGFSFFIVTFLHITLGEQVPKYIAITMAEKITMFFAFPLKIYYQIVYYPMLLINKTSEFIVKLFGIDKNKDEKYLSEDEIRLILSQSEEVGRITLRRLMMFEHLFDFGKTYVKEIMVPVDNIVYLNSDCSYDEFIRTLNQSKFSRYPIKKDGKFIGFIHIKDVFLNCVKEKFYILTNLRELKRIKENMLVENVLKIFQENNIHIALVENNNGDVVGFLSIEDIIEDIVGEIRDEFEKRPQYRLDTILDKNSSILSLKNVDRFGVIEELLSKAFENKTFLNKEDVVNKVIKREKSFSTAIGHEFAIPHARIDGLKKPVLIVGKSDNGVYFPSPDNKPVKVIFLILSPYYDPSIQLNILAKLSKLISNVTLRKKIIKAKNIDKIEEILTIFEDNIPIN